MWHLYFQPKSSLHFFAEKTMNSSFRPRPESSLRANRCYIKYKPKHERCQLMRQVISPISNDSNQPNRAAATIA